jgi:hypothetical protein
MASVTRFLDGTRAWDKIRARVLKERAYVAVAWWGKGMSELLPLAKGSVLVVRADQKTMELGQTSPDDLEVLVERGVHVFNLSNLHAKIFGFGKVAYVGSMNASVGSWQGRLLEAALESTARNAVAAARRQVLSWARDKELDLDDVDELRKHYNPRGGGEGRRQRGEVVTPTPRAAVAALPALKILRTVKAHWKDHTQDRFDKDSPALIEAASRRNENVRGVEWSDDPISVGPEERILEVCTGVDGTRWISPPARLGPITGTKRGEPEHLVYLTRTKGLRRRKMSAVLKVIGRNSRLHRALVARVRVLRDPRDLERLYGIWSIRP